MHEYLTEHFHAVEYVLAICEHLKLSALSTATACILYHKAQDEQKKLKDRCLDKYLVGPTCVYLASKLGEEALRIRDVVNISHGLLHPKEKPLEIGKTYWNLRDSITTCELMLLRLFAFDTAFETPHKYVLHFLHALQSSWMTESLEKWEESGIKHFCWSFVGDLCYLPHIATIPPHKLAVAVIYIGLKQTKLCIMENDDDEKIWYKIMCPGLTYKELKSLCCELLRLFEWIVKREKDTDDIVAELRKDAGNRKDVGERRQIDTEIIQSSSKM